MWLEPVSTAVTAAALGYDVIRNSNSIRKYAMRISYWVRNGGAFVPIFGAGGVGKSTAGRILAGDDPLELSLTYSESREPERINLQGNVPGYVVVGPGQSEGDFSRVERHWPDMFRGVLKARSKLVVNFVSYGYHSMGIDSFQQHDLYQDGMSAEVFFELYKEDRRTREIELAKRIVNSLSTVDGPVSFLTVINKQDLWWSDRDAVRAHYEGEYSLVVGELGKTLGAQRFSHEMVPVSLTLGNLITNSGEPLAYTVGGYDMGIHTTFLNGFVKVLSEKIGQ